MITSKLGLESRSPNSSVSALFYYTVLLSPYIGRKQKYKKTLNWGVLATTEENSKLDISFMPLFFKSYCQGTRGDSED